MVFLHLTIVMCDCTKCSTNTINWKLIGNLKWITWIYSSVLSLKWHIYLNNAKSDDRPIIRFSLFRQLLRVSTDKHRSLYLFFGWCVVVVHHIHTHTYRLICQHIFLLLTFLGQIPRCVLLRIATWIWNSKHAGIQIYSACVVKVEILKKWHWKKNKIIFRMWLIMIQNVVNGNTEVINYISEY